HDTSVAGYGTVMVSRAMLAPDTPIVLQYSPSRGTLDRHVARKAPTLAFVVARNSARERVVVPRDSMTGGMTRTSPEARASALVLPPAYRVLDWLNDRRNGDASGEKGLWVMTLLSALAGLIANWLTARRYAFASRRVTTWAIIGAPFRISGYVLM